jgi:ubiquinone/menaquinone biosynthesis C-methylase UbiE
MKLGGPIGRSVLEQITKILGPASDPHTAEDFIGDPSKVERMFGPSIWSRFAGKTVLDFGSARGSEAISAALHGAQKVYGLEIDRELLNFAQTRAATNGVGDLCEFINPADQPERMESLWGSIDLVYSLDSFEHFANPDDMLDVMYRLLKPGGTLLVSFGPPWNHPYGAHMGHFNRMPWIHFAFSEKTILDVRSHYRNDGATCFEKTERGLNRMTVARFTELIQKSKFRVLSFQPVPIRGLAFLTRLPLTREYFTSNVQCELVKR